MNGFIGFPKLIKKVRASQGLTQKQFAEKFGVTHASVCMWEKGVYEAPYDVIEYALDNAGYFHQDQKLKRQIIRIKNELGDKLDAIESEIQIPRQA